MNKLKRYFSERNFHFLFLSDALKPLFNVKYKGTKIIIHWLAKLKRQSLLLPRQHLSLSSFLPQNFPQQFLFSFLFSLRVGRQVEGLLVDSNNQKEHVLLQSYCCIQIPISPGPLERIPGWYSLCIPKLLLETLYLCAYVQGMQQQAWVLLTLSLTRDRADASLFEPLSKPSKPDFDSRKPFEPRFL